MTSTPSRLASFSMAWRRICAAVLSRERGQSEAMNTSAAPSNPPSTACPQRHPPAKASRGASPAKAARNARNRGGNIQRWRLVRGAGVAWVTSWPDGAD